MHLEDLRGAKREAILRLAEEYGASHVRIFGSVYPRDPKSVNRAAMLDAAEESLRQPRGDVRPSARPAPGHTSHFMAALSIARGEGDRDSDVDILVDMEKGRSLMDLGGLLMDLRQLLGCNVDVVTEAGLRERIRERVLREAVSL